MTARTRRGAIATVVAAAALLGLLAGPAGPAGAEEPDIPYFTDYSRADFNQSADANPIVGHFTDLALTDILWYQVGAGKESLWTPCPDCAQPFTKKQLPLALQVSGTYEPKVGDFAGDGLDDIYWYSSSGADYLWTNTGYGTFTSKRFDMAPGWWSSILLPDSRTGDGKDDILWYGTTDEGAAVSTRLWVFPDDGSGVARTRSRPRLPKGEPLVGDFDGNGAADILFYPHLTACRCPEPSAAASTDTLWRRSSSEAAGFTATTMNIKGEYLPKVGRFGRNGDQRDDILWVGTLVTYTGAYDKPDSLWEGRASGGFTASDLTIPSPGGSVKLAKDAGDSVLLFDGDESNVWFNTPSGPVLRPVGTQLPNGFEPVIGRFVDASREDIYAYYPGTKAEHLYHPIF